MQRPRQALGIRTAAARVKTLSAADVTLRGTYWYDLRARNPLAAGLKRLTDLVIAAPLALALSPLFLFREIVRERRAGFRGRELDVYVFRGGAFRSLPQLLNVLDGSMSLVGPRAMKPEEVERHDARRFSVKPGLTGLWRIREGREVDLDREYVNEWSLGRDLAILLTAVLRLGGPRR
jgi:lipopolysaccharide/colanic/teichoic acid biosynthesis glycosyltransferase